VVENDNSDKRLWTDEQPADIPTPAEFVPFAQELHAESDRGMALSGTAYLDDRLGKLITAYLCETNVDKLMHEGNSPLGTFSARIAMAHALGLIGDKERSELNMLRKLRNLFAHDFRQKMNDPVIIGTMSNFKELVDVGPDPLSLTDLKFAESPRDRFFHGVVRLAHQLDVRKWVIENEGLKLDPIDWHDHYF
jgi:hypothetical protein